MANIQYAAPFRSAIAGQSAALENIAKAQAARQTNLDYRFNEWYQPLKQAETQNNIAQALLKEAAQVAHYSGNYDAYNRILAHYLGVPLEALPPSYSSGKAGPAQVKAADLGSGNLPIPLSYPNVFMAGGVGAQVPQQGAPEDKELAELYRQYNIAHIKAATEALTNPQQAPGNVPMLNPLYGIPTPNATPGGPANANPNATPTGGAAPIPMPTGPTPAPAGPKIPGAGAAAASAAGSLGATDAASAYGIPQPQKPKGPSIFEGEFNPEDFQTSGAAVMM